MIIIKLLLNFLITYILYFCLLDIHSFFLYKIHFYQCNFSFILTLDVWWTFRPLTRNLIRLSIYKMRLDIPIAWNATMILLTTSEKVWIHILYNTRLGTNVQSKLFTIIYIYIYMRNAVLYYFQLRCKKRLNTKNIFRN